MDSFFAKIQTFLALFWRLFENVVQLFSLFYLNLGRKKYKKPRILTTLIGTDEQMIGSASPSGGTIEGGKVKRDDSGQKMKSTQTREMSTSHVGAVHGPEKFQARPDDPRGRPARSGLAKFQARSVYARSGLKVKIEDVKDIPPRICKKFTTPFSHRIHKCCYKNFRRNGTIIVENHLLLACQARIGPRRPDRKTTIPGPVLRPQARPESPVAPDRT